MAIQVTKDEYNIFIKIPYNTKLINIIKTTKGYRWDKGSKIWIVPNSQENRDQLQELLAYCDNINEPKYSSMETYDEVNYLEEGSLEGYVQIIKVMEQQLKLKGYSHKTRKLYMGHIRRFLKFYNKAVNEIDADVVRQYLEYLLMNKKASHSFANQAISSIKFLSSEILKKPKIVLEIPRPKIEYKLPNVLSQQEVSEILHHVENEKHKTLLFIIYASGLRVGEAVSLKITDIDSSRMMIHICQGKGKKDRYTMLSKVALEQLRKYYKLYKPSNWLFEGAQGKGHLTERTAQRVFENACVKARIRKKVSIHSLRHSFATHLLESGTDIRYIQELLGHESPITTQVYTHISKKSIAGIESPLDRIMR